MGLKEILRKTWAHRDPRWTKIENASYAVAAPLIATNAAAIIGLNEALETVSRHADNFEGALLGATYAAGAAGFYYLNRGVKIKGDRYGMIPAARALHRKIKQANPTPRTLRQSPRSALALGRLGLVGSALIVGGQQAGFEEAYRNIKGDLERGGSEIAHIATDVARAFDALRRQGVEISEDTPTSDTAQTREGNDYLPANPESSREAPINGIDVGRSFASHARTRTVSTGELAGTNMGNGLFSRYTGITGRVPAQVSVNYPNQLQHMWNMKKNWTDQNRPNTANRRVFEQVGRNLINEYRTKPATLMSIDDYARETRSVMDQARRAINWETVGNLTRLQGDRLELLKGMTESLSGRDLIAYCLTELMPSENGRLNITVLDHLLRNAGREYVDAIPAQADDFASFGCWQFTSRALFDADVNGKRVREGASRINLALPQNQRIPGSAGLLRANDHQRAALYFAIYNKANLINSLNREETRVLQDNWSKNKEGIAESINAYTAAAHTSPRDAIRDGKRWIRALDRNPGAQFTSFAQGRIAPYARKSVNNRRALYELGVGVR